MLLLRVRVVLVMVCMIFFLLKSMAIIEMLLWFRFASVVFLLISSTRYILLLVMMGSLVLFCLSMWITCFLLLEVE